MAKEYIERNETIERIRQVYCLDCESMKRYGDACCDSCRTGDAINIIDDQPAADVVEVVRCQNCDLWERGDFEPLGCCALDGRYTSPKYFCPDGEGRDK